MTCLSFESTFIRVFIFCLRWLIILFIVSSGERKNSQVVRSVDLLYDTNHAALVLLPGEATSNLDFVTITHHIYFYTYLQKILFQNSLVTT